MSKDGGAPATKKAGYTREQILKSQRYTPQQRDVLQVVLEADKTYSHEQAAAALQKFLKTEVR